MIIKQSSMVSVYETPASIAISKNYGNFSTTSKFSPSTPIYHNYRENLENNENSKNHGKRDIWVERDDFYRDGELVAPLTAIASPKNTNAGKVKKKRRITLNSDPYLLIGFDTEFKTPDVAVSKQDIEAGDAKYCVLSYQFHAKTSTGQEWTGICCPEGDERMSLPEFIVFALGVGARRHGVKNIPTQIYLVGHFTRADIPAFRDFRNHKDEFMNIRNTFATPGASMNIGITFSDGGLVPLSVGVRDTMLLTPATSKKLSALGDLLDVPKKVLQTDEHDHDWLIRNMDYCRDHHWEMFKDYAITDATIAMLYGERVISLYERVLGEKKFPITLSSIGVDLLTEKLMSNDPPLFNLLFGLEPHTGRQFSKRRNHFFKKKKAVPLVEVDRYSKEASECYHGGRNEQFWFGPGFEDTWTDFDLQSAYPTAMALIGIPLWTQMYPTSNLDEFNPTTLGFADVEFEFPHSVRYPVLPVRTDNGIIFPRTGRSRCAAPEIFVAKMLGAKLTLKFGLIVPTQSSIRPFEQFTKECIGHRIAAGKKSLEGLFWKEIINSTYGKTAQGLLEKRVYNLRDADTEALGPSTITNPYLAAFITSAVRAVLGEMMNGLPADKMVFSCTTDGFLTNATKDEMSALSTGALYQVFAAARSSLTGDPSVLEVKHVIRQPLGWRTRGQATLIAGCSTLTVGLEDGSTILAKGGIYLPKHLETVEKQNDAIVDLFFDRTPDSMIHVIGSIGIRDMMLHDADLVDKTFTKRLSMEYDWKRCPAHASIDPSKGHLVFSTRPWDSINQFLLIRDAWEQYSKIKQACLKTVADFQNFMNFADSRFMVSDAVKRYLPKIDGDLKRLRMSFCGAWKHDRAGLSSSEYLYSAQDIADVLVVCGVPCIKTDVENGKKRPFMPNRVPPTERVMQAIDELRNFFPTLNETELLYRSETEDHLRLSNGSTCPFVSRLTDQASAVVSVTV